MALKYLQNAINLRDASKNYPFPLVKIVTAAVK